MKSQGMGGSTQRYFMLTSHSLRYWKGVPARKDSETTADGSGGRGRGSLGGEMDSEADNGHCNDCEDCTEVELEPCKGQMPLSHLTTLRRAKTLFGHSTIEIKSNKDVLTVCAASAAEDVVWFNEISSAVEKLKKAHNDLTAGSERRFPELTWRSPEPSCVAVDVDVVDQCTAEDKEREFRAAGSLAMANNTSGSSCSSGVCGGKKSSLSYAVLCCVKTSLSTFHSVQLGPHHHVSLRLENSDLDAGVQLSAVRLCGDCLVVSGSQGFVGSGRIPSLAEAGEESGGGGMSSTTSSASGSSVPPQPQRIYVRRMVNCFHGEDAKVTCLAVPRPSVGEGKTKGGGRGRQANSMANILASGDEIGGVCVWRREEGSRGVLHYPTYDGQQSKERHRAGHSWQCVHR